MSGCIQLLSNSHSPVFLLNSCLGLFSAPPTREDPFSRSYGASLPSSLTVNLPTPQYALRGHVCPFAVRVTGAVRVELSGFSREHACPHYPGPPRGTRYCQGRLGARTSLRPSAPTPFNALFRLRAAVSLLRPRIAPHGSDGMLTVMPSASPFGLALGPD